MIEAIDAHIWWDTKKKRAFVTTFPSDIRGFQYDGGASYTRWRTRYTDADRVREMMDILVELFFRGFDPMGVVREFAKVRQFRELGLESWPMARVLAAALGRPGEFDPEEFRVLFLDE